MTNQSDWWDKEEQEIESGTHPIWEAVEDDTPNEPTEEPSSNKPDTRFLRHFDPNTKCDHGRLVIEGQCLKCLFGNEYDNPEELR